MNQQEVQKIITILQPVWPASGLDKVTIPAWTTALQGQDSGLLQEAAAEWVRTEKWFPKPSELIAIARERAYQIHSANYQALPEPQRVDPPLEYKRRIVAKCREMGVNNPVVNQWAADIEQRGAA